MDLRTMVAELDALSGNKNASSPSMPRVQTTGVLEAQPKALDLSLVLLCPM